MNTAFADLPDSIKNRISETLGPSFQNQARFTQSGIEIRHRRNSGRALTPDPATYQGFVPIEEEEIPEAAPQYRPNYQLELGALRNSYATEYTMHNQPDPTEEEFYMHVC